MAVEIRSYNRKGLQMLWNRVRETSLNKEDALDKIYKTYGRKQWEQKCAQFNFYKYS